MLALALSCAQIYIVECRLLNCLCGAVIVLNFTVMRGYACCTFRSTTVNIIIRRVVDKTVTF